VIINIQIVFQSSQFSFFWKNLKMLARNLVHTKITKSFSLKSFSRGFSQDPKKGASGSKWGMGKQPPQPQASQPQTSQPQATQQTPPKYENPKPQAYTPRPTGKGGVEMPRLTTKTEESKCAWALLDSANRLGKLDEVARDAKIIIGSTQGGSLAAIGRIFTDRALTTKDRLRKAEPILKNLNPLTRRLISRLINQMNGVLVPGVMENFLSLLREAKKDYTAVVSTPKPITAEEKQKYIQIAKEKINRGPDVHVNIVERIDNRLESGFTLSLTNLYVNKGRVKDEGKKDRKKSAILTGISTSAIKDMEGPKISYDQWLMKHREQMTEDLIKDLQD